MREIQASFHAKEERHADRADRLEAEVARLSRDDSDSMTATDRSVNLGWYPGPKMPLIGALFYMICHSPQRYFSLKIVGSPCLYCRLCLPVDCPNFFDDSEH